MRSTTIASSSRSSIRKLSTWGVTEGDPGCVRSLTRSSPDNTGDRSDPFRSHPDNSERVSSRLVSPSTANDRCPATSANFPWSEARRHPHRDVRIEISSSAFHVRSDTRSAYPWPISTFFFDDCYYVLSCGITRNHKMRILRRRVCESDRRFH